MANKREQASQQSTQRKKSAHLGCEANEAVLHIVPHTVPSRRGIAEVVEQLGDEHACMQGPAPISPQSAKMSKVKGGQHNHITGSSEAFRDRLQAQTNHLLFVCCYICVDAQDAQHRASFGSAH